MPSKQHPFLNFQVDHMAMHAEPDMYAAAYLFFRIIFGVSKEDVIYEKRVEWDKNVGEESMTYAVRIGQHEGNKGVLHNTMIAMIQPSEPLDKPSHVRKNLKDHSAAALWMHIALRTNDLISFHDYALNRGVNFITPIMKDEDDDLIQVFSGEWYLPGGQPSGTFFEFVQRDITPSLLKKLEEHNRESWFRDKTFLGLYEEKEREYQSGNIKPFIDHELFTKVHSLVKNKKFWDISEEDIQKAEKIMLEYAANKRALAKK
ncbi:MAG: hypothetical protein HYR97_02545 [Candidatus Melainabacteria bacterium]|nr:hypothetical protein [Candidatus Melainabacteria bacterium]